MSKHSNRDIDISTSNTGPKLGLLGNAIIWSVVLLLFLCIYYLELSLYWVLALVPVVVLAFAGWIAWRIVFKRGVFTWMRLALKPGKLMALGDAAGAEAACAKALERARRFASDDHRRGLMLCELAMFIKNQGRYAEALAAYEESVSILAKHADKEPIDYFIGLNNYGICFIALKDFEAAQRMLEKALDLLLAARKREANAFQVMPPKQVTALEFLLHVNLAVLFLSMEELAEAEQQLRGADTLLPLMSKGFQKLWHDHYICICALWEFESGKFAAAASEIEDAHNPDYFVCLRIRARLHLMRLEFAQAEELLRKYHDDELKRGTLHRPELLKPTLEFAECLFGQGKHDEALAALQDARAIVADFSLPADEAWRKALTDWLKRAREIGKADLETSLQADLQKLPIRMEQRVTVLDKFRAVNQAPG